MKSEEGGLLESDLCIDPSLPVTRGGDDGPEGEVREVPRHRDEALKLRRADTTGKASGESPDAISSPAGEGEIQLAAELTLRQLQHQLLHPKPLPILRHQAGESVELPAITRGERGLPQSGCEIIGAAVADRLPPDRSPPGRGKHLQGGTHFSQIRLQIHPVHCVEGVRQIDQSAAHERIIYMCIDDQAVGRVGVGGGDIVQQQLVPSDRRRGRLRFLLLFFLLRQDQHVHMRIRQLHGAEAHVAEGGVKGSPIHRKATDMPPQDHAVTRCVVVQLRTLQSHPAQWQILVAEVGDRIRLRRQTLGVEHGIAIGSECLKALQVELAGEADAQSLDRHAQPRRPLHRHQELIGDPSLDRRDHQETGEDDKHQEKGTDDPAQPDQ